jgi:pyruvate/2-oxoglutarate/acetoin dehydrogenase E1 component
MTPAPIGEDRVRDTTMGEAVREALREEMLRNPDVVVLGPYARGGAFNGGITRGLVEEFGEERVLDTPASEAALAGLAAGLAAAGLRPFVDVGNFGFAFSLLDQVSNQVAKAHYTFNGQLSLPAVYWFETAYRGWGVHHSQAVYALLAHLPGLKLAVPSNARDVKGQLRRALRGKDPVAFMVHPELLPSTAPVEETEYFVRIGDARVARAGADVTIVTCGWFVPRALEAAETLGQEGISAEVVDLRSLVPLDWDIVLSSVQKTGRAVVYDQGHYTCGVAVTVAAGIQERVFRALRGPVRVVAAADVPVPYNLRLEDAVVPSTARLLGVVREVLGSPP